MYQKAIIPFLLILASFAQGANLAPEAAYSVTVSGYIYHNQVLPGSNTPATAVAYVDAPAWQGPPLALVDGKRDGDAVTSWFWSAQSKRITATFDLRRAAKVTGLRVFGSFEGAMARVAETEAGLGEVQEVKLTAADGGFVWEGEAASGRFVRVVCASGEPQMSLAEVEIEGEAAGPVVTGAPPVGLIAVPARDLAALTALPEKAAGVTNLAGRAETKVTVTSGHYDGKQGKTIDDTCARDSDPTGRALVDGKPATVVASFADWYAHKSVTVELDLGEPFEVERVVVWSAGAGETPAPRGGGGAAAGETPALPGGGARAYVNAVQMWVRPVPGAPWMPLGETRNPVLPAEKPGAEYAIVPAAIGKPAQFVRLRFEGVAQSADVMRIGEIEVWGKAVTGAINARAWKLRKAVPEIEPVALGKVDPAHDWIMKERLRGLYGYSFNGKDTALLKRAREVGFNCFIMHTSGKENHSEKGWRAICAEWAKIQADYGLKVIVSWPFGSDERYGNTQFGDYQPGGRTVWKRTPCPLSSEYWNRVIGDRAEDCARAGLTGLVADMEMYGADATGYAGPCVCDRCWGSFVQEYLEGVEPGDVALADRPAWLAANGLSADYTRRQELGIMAILRGIEQRVHAVKPDFMLGNLLFLESVAGMARGFGTPTMPALVFSEVEYGGNLSGTAGRVARLAAEGYPALYLTGLTPTVIKADAYARLIRDAAVAGNGWWVWSSLAYQDAERPGYNHRADFTTEEYWRATEAGHGLVDEGLKGR